MPESIRNVVSDAFRASLTEIDVLPPTEFPDDFVLLESGVDSMGFAVLITGLEDTLGYDPFSLMEDAFYPTTFGELVAAYEQFSEQRQDLLGGAGAPL
jgi:hypothetical protein